jgi:hypothetical protein
MIVAVGVLHVLGTPTVPSRKMLANFCPSLRALKHVNLIGVLEEEINGMMEKE